MEFKDRIKALRLAQGSTLEQIGEAVGVSKATVKRWESGEIANLRRDKIYKLSKALHTTPAYLMGWEDENASLTSGDSSPLISAKAQPMNTIRIAGRDGSLVERQLTDEQLALFQSMLDQMKPIDDENI